MRWITSIAMIATSLTARVSGSIRCSSHCAAIRASKSSARKGRNKDLTTDHAPPVAAATYGAAKHKNSDEQDAIIGGLACLLTEDHKANEDEFRSSLIPKRLS